jgi:hypothetical protein
MPSKGKTGTEQCYRIETRTNGKKKIRTDRMSAKLEIISNSLTISLSDLSKFMLRTKNIS